MQALVWLLTAASPRSAPVSSVFAVRLSSLLAGFCCAHQPPAIYSSAVLFTGSGVVPSLGP